MFPALAGEFLTTAPPGKSQAVIFIVNDLTQLGLMRRKGRESGNVQIRKVTQQRESYGLPEHEGGMGMVLGPMSLLGA